MRGALQDLGILKGTPRPRAFIVHGHDETALLQLRNYLQIAVEFVSHKQRADYKRLLVIRTLRVAYLSWKPRTAGTFPCVSEHCNLRVSSTVVARVFQNRFHRK
jgi:hypothetical protein